MSRGDVLQALKRADGRLLAVLESACLQVFQIDSKGRLGMTTLRESLEDFARQHNCSEECRPIMTLLNWYEARFDDLGGAAISEFRTDLEIAKNDQLVKRGC